MGTFSCSEEEGVTGLGPGGRIKEKRRWSCVSGEEKEGGVGGSLPLDEKEKEERSRKEPLVLFLEEGSRRRCPGTSLFSEMVLFLWTRRRKKKEVGRSYWSCS